MKKQANQNEREAYEKFEALARKLINTPKPDGKKRERNAKGQKSECKKG
jgi:hypothetical protein